MKINRITAIITSSLMIVLSGCRSNTTPEERPFASEVYFTQEKITMAVGQDRTLEYETNPANAKRDGISFSVDKFSSSYLTVNQDGVLTAISATPEEKNATVTIITKTGLFSDTCSVKVVPQLVPATSISLSESQATMSIGETKIVTATVIPEISTDVIHWNSSNSSVATVSNGQITAVSNGKTTITATTDSGKKDSIEVTVKFIDATGITLSASRIDLYEQVSKTITAEVLPKNASNKTVNWSSDDSDVAYINSEGVIKGKKVGVALITGKTHNGYSATCKVVVTETPSIQKSEIKYTYKDYSDNCVYTLDSTPSKGKPTLLVVPVWFTNSDKFIKAANKEQIKNDIDIAINGTNEETGWRSLRTYYQEESFGECNITGIVTDWYPCDKKYNEVSSTGATVNLVKSAVKWYKNTYGDTSVFDYDKNGYIDGVILVYGAPDYYRESSVSSNFWAYTYWVQGQAGTPSSPNANVFMWLSYDFMYGQGKESISSYLGGNTSHCNIDTHTYIHEMGHMFGLCDYYDYNNGQTAYSAAGGWTMQDHNVGAHDPFSKMALGWAQPYVPEESITLTIKPNETSGDFIILSPSFTGSPFDEYIIIDLYTPDGLNAFDSEYQYSWGYPTGVKTAGCRVWHVDARLTHYTYGGFSGTDTIPNNYCYHAITNTTYAKGNEEYCSVLGKDYYNFRLLQLIRNDYTIDEKCNDNFSKDSLFVSGDTFDIKGDYSNCFVNNGSLNNGKTLGWKVLFDSVSSDRAVITIMKTN